MTTPQSEAQLEKELINHLQDMEYDFVSIKNEDKLLVNLKNQLEKHNNISFSNKEFSKILNHLNKGNVFERAKILRDKMMLEMDNGDKKYIEFINMSHWCQNEFQVTNQISMEGSYKNRYDVTLLINGLPLVQIELKRRGLELKEAFNQTGRYHKHSFWAGSGLFQYIQIFVISNGVNTKYYANNKKQSFKQTFFWADVENNNITNLEEFTKEFLEPCHLSKMITRYIVLNETSRILMVLRPYQYYATEMLIERVKNSSKNGYIWHTTGSGKTLTSFKASQILTKLPQVNKVVFVVDRKDLDYQTTREFNSFSKGSIDGTDNTKQLVAQFEDDTPLIVTTIQKLNVAISKAKYLKKMEKLADEKVVFIFDECHRSQFGDTHKKISNFFTNHQMFGFTGTPIFAKNNIKKRTTADLFEECLHKYVITDAIKDENVLKFSIEYLNTFKRKKDFDLTGDEKVEDINTKEIYEDPERLEKVVDYIINIHNSKTHSKNFNSIFCISSIDTLIKYYDIFKRKDHNLKIATIFSYAANEDDKNADGLIDDVNLDVKDNEANKHSRDKLEEFIGDYNQEFGSKFTTKDSQSYYNYYNDIAKKVKNREIDILLVVNMFLTGFDSPTLNTLYVDKNLKYHGVIQAFSRTNRILNDKKSQGNIVCFRNLKKNTDEAIALFSNKNAKETILIEPIENYISKFNNAFERMNKLAPTVESVDKLISENDKFQFVQAFRELIRIRNVLETFTEFKFDSLAIDRQDFEDYKSKYLDIYDNVRNQTDKVSILDDIDFELELIRRDEINIDYIIFLLSSLYEAESDNRKKHKEEILSLVNGEVKLRNKKELIEKFIEENLLNIKDSSNVEEEFERFLNIEKSKEFKKFCEDENIDSTRFEKVLNSYLYTGKMPLRENIVETMKEKPKLLERSNIIKRITQKMLDFVEKFE